MRWTPLLLASALVACNAAPRNLLVRPYDAGGDAPEGGDEAPPPDAQPDADPTLGGPCTDATQCNDNVACTYDSCDATLHRCRNVPDDTQCDDGIYCDGKERCVLHHGCEPGPVVSCDDGNPCNIASCVEATKSCAYAPRDVDQDSDPDDHCVPHHDCNDLDPTVSSKHLEVCANGKDDNCNGLVDEMPCVQPQGDTCASAVTITAPGTYALSTAGDKKDYATSCSVTTPMSAQDLVAAVTIPPGTHQDLDVWATTPGPEVSLAVESTCGQDATEIACTSAPGASAMRVRARNLAPGTYYVIVTTQAPTSLELQVSFLAPSPPATNVDCGSAIPILFDTPVNVSIIDPPTNLVSACMAQTGELTYALTVAQPSDVRVFASTTQGSGAPIVGLRAPHCTDPGDELFCRSVLPPALFARGLAPGIYVLTVAATSPIDTTLLAKAYAPTPAPPGETCATAPSAAQNTVFPVDLTNNEGAIRDGCLPGGVSSSFDVMLAQPSDVLVVGRFPQNETGAVSLDTPVCDPASAILCAPTTSTPTRIGKRNVGTGDYRVVLTDQLGEVDSLEVLVRPTAAPVSVSGADLCANALTIPMAGGFFVGDTSNASANYSSGCDSPSAPPNGANDQVLSLNLTQPQRVVFDMEGSTYTTLLDIRQGPTCPGPEVGGACYVGFGPEKSFLDIELQPGAYWVVVDGYDGAQGAWNLDVRVLPP